MWLGGYFLLWCLVLVLNIGPSRLANKLRTILVAIDYVISKIPESGATAEEELTH